MLLMGDLGRLVWCSRQGRITIATLILQIFFSKSITQSISLKNVPMALQQDSGYSTMPLPINDVLLMLSLPIE
jgi:hypothetical protein